MMFLSLRHLLSRKKQSFFILLGITIGTSAYVSISGMMLGFQNFIYEQLVNNEAHIRISAREDVLKASDLNVFQEAQHIFWSIPPSGRKDSSKIEYPLGWFDKLDKDTDVTAYSPQVVSQVIFSRGKVSKTGRIIGSQFERQMKVTNIEKYMKVGSFKDLGNSGNRMIIGSALMDQLGTRPSETLLVSTGGESGAQPFKIVGVFETGIKNIDESTSFLALVDAQKLRRTPSEITDIAVKLFEPTEAESKAQAWKLFSKDKIVSWQESSAAILSVFKTQDIVRNSMTIAIIVVAGFGIYNILSILVNQKKRDIAILRSMGFTPKDIVQLFLNQGVLLGVIGGFLGLILGYIICQILSRIEVTPGRMSGPGNLMIISFEVMIYFKAFFIALISSVLSSIIPAREAGKLEPIEIIRSGGQ
jgi:lipoprotein-releasing system permease protein